MDLSFDESQRALRDAARAFLAERSSSERVRAAMASEHGFEPEVWRRIGGELGWTALAVPEECGGLGLGPVELTALMEELGAALLCAPFFSTVCLGGAAILEAGDEEQRRAHLPAIAAGASIATLALAEPGGRWDPAGIEAELRPAGDGFVLAGVKRYVPDGAAADLLVVAARRPGTGGDAGLSLVVVPGDAAGLERRALPTLDRTRRQAEVRLREVRVPRSAVLGEEGGAGPALERVLDRALVALAAEQVGGAQRCLDMAVAYAKERVQFGRPIGSFQAIKHKCADMLVALESARSAAYYAAAAAAADDPELPVLASLAKVRCSEAFFRCAAEAIQIHGGIGFTWEHDCHLYFKRARSSATLLGDPAYHRERIAGRIGL